MASPGGDCPFPHDPSSMRRRIWHAHCVALGRAPRRSLNYASGALGRAPCIHAHLHHLATNPGEICGIGRPSWYYRGVVRRNTRRVDSLNVSLSTHLFAFHDLDEAIFRSFPGTASPSREIWAMPPHFPSGDLPAADGIARQMASLGIRVASVHAPLYPDVRTYKKDRWHPPLLPGRGAPSRVRRGDRTNRRLARRQGTVALPHLVPGRSSGTPTAGAPFSLR